MIPAFLSALHEIFDPRLRRILALSIVLSVVVLAALAGGLGYLLYHTTLFDAPYLNGAVELLGGLAILVLAWLLFPAIVTLVLGFYLDGAIALVEARRYARTTPPSRQSIAAAVGGGVRLALLGIALNLLALPLYLLLPGVSLVLFYGLNGWLLGREYFELVALRRLDARQTRLLWLAERPRLVAAGVVIAFLLTVPLVNLAAPLIGALFMLHLVERLRHFRETC